MILCLFALWRLLGRQENPVCNAVFRFNFYFPRSNYCLLSTICCTQYQSMLLFCLISILNLIRIDPLLWLVNCVKCVKVVNSCQKLLWALLTPCLCYAAFYKSYSQWHCLHHLNLHGLSVTIHVFFWDFCRGVILKHVCPSLYMQQRSYSCCNRTFKSSLGAVMSRINAHDDVTRFCYNIKHEYIYNYMYMNNISKAFHMSPHGVLRSLFISICSGRLVEFLCELETLETVPVVFYHVS